MTTQGQINPEVIESVKIGSTRHNEILQKRNNFSPKQKYGNTKKNYIDNKPINTKTRPYSPQNKKSSKFILYFKQIIEIKRNWSSITI